MDDIATYSDALPSVPSNQESLEYPQVDDDLMFSDDFMEYFTDYNNYYVSTRKEHEALNSVDFSNSQAALVQMEYIRTYETIKTKETVTGILILILFALFCSFFRRWIG